MTKSWRRRPRSLEGRTPDKPGSRPGWPRDSREEESARPRSRLAALPPAATHRAHHRTGNAGSRGWRSSTSSPRYRSSGDATGTAAFVPAQDRDGRAASAGGSRGDPVDHSGAGGRTQHPGARRMMLTAAPSVAIPAGHPIERAPGGIREAACYRTGRRLHATLPSATRPEATSHRGLGTGTDATEMNAR